MAYITRAVAQRGLLVQRALSTSAVRHGDVAFNRDEAFPWLGKREIVGPGENNLPSYIDQYDFPLPAVRYKENTPEIEALRVKEKGDWKTLTIEEKKALYRASFRQTFAELHAPTGEWKSILAAIILSFAVSGWMMVYMRTMVYPPLPSTVTQQWKEDSVRRMVLEGQGPMEGVSSWYDYDKEEWKK